MDTAFEPSTCEQIPYFAEDSGAQLHNGCILWRSSGDERVDVAPDVADFLGLVDGERTFQDLFSSVLDRRSYELDDAYAFFKSILQLMKCGILRTHVAPLKTGGAVRDLRRFHLPDCMHVEVTDNCNLRCAYCYRDAKGQSAPNYMDTGKLFPLIDELAGFRLSILEITGGEPLLHPRIFDILEYCHRKLSRFSLLTNGTLVNEETAAILSTFKDKMVVNVSLNSHLEREHDRRTLTGGSWAKTRNAIRLLSSQRILVRAAMVMDEGNWPHLEETILLARELGAVAFSCSPVIPLGRGRDAFIPWALDAQEVRLRDGEIKEKYKEFLHVLSSEEVARSQGKGGCGLGHRTYAMAPNGDIRLCVSMDPQIGVIGNLFKMDPLDVFSNRLCALSQELLPPSRDVCETCPSVEFCTGCPLRGLTASPGHPDCRWRSHPSVKEWADLVEGPQNDCAQGEGHEQSLSDRH